jgi:hypothetical protein
MTRLYNYPYRRWNMVPEYIKHAGKVIKEDDTHTEVELVCECGEKCFHVFKNEPTDEEISKIAQWEKRLKGFRKIEGMSDEEGNVFLVKRNIFGKIVDKVRISDMPEVSKINFLKSICVSCGREYVVFDNRIHGYDANCESETKDISYNGFVFAKVSDEALRIVVKYENNSESYEEYVESFGYVSREKFSNMFGWIYIYGYNKKSRRLIFEEETS